MTAGVRAFVLGLLLVAGVLPQRMFGQAAGTPSTPAVFQIEFTNAKLSPPHWVLKFSQDGSGLFESDGGFAAAGERNQIVVGPIRRPVQLSPEFTAHVFTVARQRKLFNFPCEGNLKVAFQGTKKLSYAGPEGAGSCEYNYSKDKEIQELGDSLQGVETTILDGARLEMLLQHDRLGLDKAMEDLAGEAHSGNALEVGTIRETLEKIANDESVLERARRKARLLLTTGR